MADDAWARDLERLGEAPFWSDRQGPDAYRVLLHRPMRLPLLVRVERSSRGWLVVATDSAWDRPKVVRREHEVLSSELAGFEQSLEAAGFWSSNQRLAVPPDPLEIDPCLWLIEGRRDGRYGVVEISTDIPGPRSDALRRAARELIRVGAVVDDPGC